MGGYLSDTVMDVRDISLHLFRGEQRVFFLNKVFYKPEYVNNRIRSYENIKL